MKDDTLILYYYEDGLTEAERRDVRTALERDAELRQRYERLRADLTRLDTKQRLAVAPHVAARWHDSIARAARLERQRNNPHTRAFHLPSFAWGTAVTAALVVGIAIGLFVAGDDGTPETYAVDTGPPGTTSPSVTFARGLKVHLRESRNDLADLPATAGDERRMLVTHMIEQNRLFERAAEQNGSKDLARVLRAFEPILVRLAEDDITDTEADALHAKLAFELNVMLTKLGRTASEDTGPI